jgi:hypothetical protein
MTSHPFVVGYRGGRYRELWGGSPVHAPILEVDLGDLDGDGLDELAAIEAPIDDSARYVTVWRWHGWGFSLLWRSPPGEYHDLILLPAEKDQPTRLSVSLHWPGAHHLTERRQHSANRFKLELLRSMGWYMEGSSLAVPAARAAEDRAGR